MKSNSSRSKRQPSTNIANAKEGLSSDVTICNLHEFSSDEIQCVRKDLLKWFHTNKRDLPWRRLAAEEKDRNRRGYAVWVSEVMLQQTQVATVKDYYVKWMGKWPTLQDLSCANLEEVNEMWAGLGYYSRARRLHEGSKKIVDKMAGEMPTTAANLMKHLPGVGRYTAGAIASIAFGEHTGVVDGNVVRVLSRLRVIGQDSATSIAIDAFWKLITEILDEKEPGNFNQAMMELGATICTPKTPQCQKCPLQGICLANKQAQNTLSSEGFKSYFTGKTKDNDLAADDIEDLASKKCDLCFPNDGTWKTEFGVCNYPRKQKLKPARREKVAVCILEYQGDKTDNKIEVFLCKRPSSGLLAGLWEFPNLVVNDEWTEEKLNKELLLFMKNEFNMVLLEENLVSLGETHHLFSHIHHTYVVKEVLVSEKSPLLENLSTTGRSTRWLTNSEFSEAAVSTNMKKVFNLYRGGGQNNKGTKRKHEEKDGSRKQQLLDTFLIQK